MTSPDIFAQLFGQRAQPSPEPSNAERYAAAQRRVRVLSRVRAATESPEFVRAVAMGAINRGMADAVDILQAIDEQIEGLTEECCDEIRETEPASDEEVRS